MIATGPMREFSVAVEWHTLDLLDLSRSLHTNDSQLVYKSSWRPGEQRIRRRKVMPTKENTLFIDNLQFF